ncbi:V-type ATP synthase subunit B [Petroclostridium xylanilyticum]|uniref:V-type ATP synthase subunit B n=1 Tax=Petroclostridium xylanilyticum TaxID=1792311 RepID=UPI000B98C4C2|nr:V-type ATP synthase subunit B [Petroclostridium xylanilyticum]
MKLEYIGLKQISGPLVIIEGIQGASFEEMVEITVDNSEKRIGRIIELYGDIAVVQVFEGTSNISLTNTKTRLLGHSLEIPLSKEILGRIFDGVGRPIDGMGEIFPEVKWDVNGKPINPVSREYPRNYIQTGISSIDGLTTLIRGQKLPIFSGNGLPHDALAVQIVRQAQLAQQEDAEFAVVFAAMGVKHDVADYFKRSFEESGVLQKVVMFLNLANDPVVERIITPRCALTVAEYLAFQHNMHILVILTDMTSYCEALREISSSKGEIPSRKGFPGYLYSDLASLYERAGMLKDRKGSITQIPILTMPNDDITHPVPDLTGYITEGQIVLDRSLHQRGVYPPVIVLPSLSRLMKDGIGEGFTREDHPAIANQLFASYAHVQEVRALASVIGEDELSEIDKKYIEFGKAFEREFISQNKEENRSMDNTLDLGWRLLGILPKEELDRVDVKILDKYYRPYSSTRSEL